MKINIKNLIKIPETILIGLLAGFVSGLLGIGGGSVLIPGMIFFLKFDQKTAQGTSLWAIIPIAAVASTRYYVAGNLNISYAFWLMSGSMFGILIGSTFAHKIHAVVLTKLFGVFMIGVSIKLIFF